jgi:hypothetical protein
MAVIDTASLFGSGANASFGNTVIGFNTISNYLFTDFLLMVMFVIIVFVLRNYEFRDSFLASSTIVWLLSLVLWISQFTDFTRVVVCFSVLVVAIAMSYFKD